MSITGIPQYPDIFWKLRESLMLADRGSICFSELAGMNVSADDAEGVFEDLVRRLGRIDEDNL